VLEVLLLPQHGDQVNHVLWDLRQAALMVCGYNLSYATVSRVHGILKSLARKWYLAGDELQKSGECEGKGACKCLVKIKMCCSLTEE